MRKYQDIEPAGNLGLEACNAKIEAVNPEKWFDVIFKKVWTKFLSKKEIPIVESDMTFLFNLVAIQLTNLNLEDSSSKNKLEMVQSIKEMAESLVAYNLIVAEALKTFLKDYKKSEVHYDPADNPHEPYFWVNLMLHVIYRYCSIDSQDENFVLRDLIQKIFGIKVEDFDYFVSDILSFRKKVKLKSRKHPKQKELVNQQRSNIENTWIDNDVHFYEALLFCFDNQASGWKEDLHHIHFGLYKEMEYDLVNILKKDQVGSEITKFYLDRLKWRQYVNESEQKKINNWIKNYLSENHPYFYDVIKNHRYHEASIYLSVKQEKSKEYMNFIVQIMVFLNFTKTDFSCIEENFPEHLNDEWFFEQISNILYQTTLHSEIRSQIISDLIHFPSYSLIFIAYIEEIFKKFDGDVNEVIKKHFSDQFNDYKSFLSFAKKYKKSKKGFAKRIGFSLPRVKKVDPVLKGILDHYGFNFLGYSIDELCKS